MILLTLTTDGGDREDGNVYYATYLLIDVSPEERPKISAFLRKEFGGKARDGDDVVFQGLRDEEIDKKFDDTDSIVASLAAAGWPTQAVQQQLYLISEHS